MEATEAMIDGALFGPSPRVSCDFAEWNGEAVGFALWFLNFSTFSGRAGLYLEDLFVRPAFRGRGIGKALMAHLARRCVENGWARLQWSVLDWNTPSIEFYKSLGGVMLDEWTGVRVSGDALARLAKAGG
jgi:GNAT superfamily N-acetyltransferase